jgi:hypothetical protein
MPRHTWKFFLIPLFLLMLMAVTGCHRREAAPSPSPESFLTPAATTRITLPPSPSPTAALVATITPRPSSTPTITLTPYPTATPTPTPTRAPSRPAILFTYQDVHSRTVDWSYAHITRIGENRFGEVNDLWAFIGFQLLDRSIHQRNFKFEGEIITVYYLNVAHQFNGAPLPMQLVLGGTSGKSVPIADIPAGGTAYLQVQVRDASDPFDPYITHRDANRAYELREESYPLMFLKDFQAMLPNLPDEIILLADHPILFPRDDWPQVKLDMQRVSYLAARYQPFFSLDPYDRLIDQSDFAYALRDYLIDSEALPDGIYTYSSRTLIIITGEN